MTITLGKKGGQTLNITDRLDADFDLILTQELERDAFERVVEDVRLRVSNLDGMLTSMLAGIQAGERWEIRVSHFDPFAGGERLLFHGEIDPGSVTFDLRDEWFAVTAFSLNRIFWDRAKTTLVKLQFTEAERSMLYAPVQWVLQRELGPQRTGPDGASLFAGDLFDTLEVRGDIGIRQIRFYADANGDPAIGNNGMYSDLDPQTTVYDLLTAICIYNNAECAIDCETRTLVVQKRSAVNNDRAGKGDPGADLSGLLLESSPIEWAPVDQTRYRWLYAPYEVTRAAPPVYLGQTLSTETLLGTLAGDRYLTYYLTNMVGEYESAPSAPVRILHKMNEPLSGPGLNVMGSYHITLRIPEGSPSTTQRRLYRTVPGSEDMVRLLVEFEGNTETTFEDTIAEQTGRLLPGDGPSATAAWFSYDESKGVWNAPIPDYPPGVNEPAGSIFRVLPRLSFRSPVNHASIVPYDLYDIYSFFGRSNSFERIVQQFDTLLRSIPKVRCRVGGINYRVGDTVRLSLDGVPEKPGTWVIKKASVNLSAEETVLEIMKL